MLKFLSIRDFVIVSSLDLDFSAGFTALTGETGAGKSILIGALSLALGERGDASMVRNGCERAEIAAEFDIAALPHLQTWLRDQELDGDDGICLLRRVLDAGGRSRGFINGRSATLQQLREAGEQLLDIHGQHAHQSLLRPDAQRVLLDGYAGMAADAEKVAALYRDWQALRRRRIGLSENAETVAAERNRRAVVTEAEGKRSATITVAEGDKQSAILRAEGERQSRILMAEGFSLALDRIFSVAKTIDSKTLALQYLEALKALGASPATKFVFPMEFEKFLRPLSQYADEAFKEDK